jgi:phospholipid N-methyltransferase
MGLLSVASTNQHEYYVSVTRVEYVSEHKAVQIISQIFIDDFEKLIRKRYDDSIVLAIEDESEKVNTYMERYLKKKLVFQINGKQEDYLFLGKKYEDDIVYCYMEIENIPEVKRMEIVNDILYDLYDEQENIVRTKINSRNKSFILTSAKNKAVLNFN